MSSSKIWDAVALLHAAADDAPPCTRCGCTRRVLSSTKGSLCPGCGASYVAAPLQEELSAQVASLQVQRDDYRQRMRALAKQLEAAEQRAAAAEGGRESLLQVIRIMGQSG